ncbi:hypothetical protein LOTGIDRAFT_237682 [Lottia gigantea]|uniref:TFIID subunit TAF5 NTD2 domain-containing protein n=1 Tax=Lottia gigantea TaxID=225164 RepID=V4B750_LOTGI|nr:hypothetical protein LOTGIDRAFT_237682 [Lottia gigantea]ESP03366.1 hypothetical protein LOTGIDRAFT_237682 [Lottia gigantea]
MCDVERQISREEFYKMRRLKREEIMTSVNHYLRRRKFDKSETQATSEEKVNRSKRLCCREKSLTELSVISQMNSSSLTENILSFSSISGDVTACDQQFTKLKNFILEGLEAYKIELKSLLYPIFVHVYLEMLCNGHKMPAHKFYDRHSSLFKDDDLHKPVMRILRKLDMKTDVLSCKDITEFLDNRYHVNLSEDTLAYLLRYLKNEDNMIMFQIFNQFLKVVVPTCASTVELREGSKNELRETDSKDIKDECNNDNQTVLKQAISKIRDGPPSISSICCYTFLNTSNGLYSVDVSSNNSLISAGFEDSTISLWSLDPDLIHTNPFLSNPAVITLAVDHCTGSDDSNNLSQRKKDVETIKLRGHNGAVYKTCFTPDSQYLLSASLDNSVRLWDLSSHSNVVLYRGHSSAVWSLDTSGLGYFVSCSQDRTAKLWSYDRNYPIRSFIGHTYDVDVVKFHPNSNYVATGSGDRTIRLWSLQDGRCVRLLQGHHSSILSLAFSPNGQYLASAGEDRRIKIWDLSSGTLFKELQGHSDTVYSLNFNPDSTILASGGLDCCVRLWDVRKNREVKSELKPSGISDNQSSPELHGIFSTKSTSILFLRFSKNNVLRVAGNIL